MARRNDSKDLLGWINKKDAHQCRWAVEYLAARQFSSSIKVEAVYVPILRDEAYARYFEDIECQLSDRASESADSKEAISSLIKKMRAAWNAKKNRSKSRGRKAYSYVMSKDIEEKLRKLAGDNPINKTLEKIICQEFFLYENEQALFKLKYEKSMSKHEKLQKRIDYLGGKLNSVNIQMGIECATNKKIMETIYGLYFKIATQEIIMRKMQDISDELNDAEQAEAMKIQENRMKFFKKKLNSEIAAIGVQKTRCRKI